ncbi:MAG: ribonuclease T2 [Pseudomonadota bacterium]
MLKKTAGLLLILGLGALGYANVPLDTAGIEDQTSARNASIRSAQPKPDSEFDYYVLALSWSPSFCQSRGDDAPQSQCGTGRSFGFIVHGLWPQYEAEGWPEYCLGRNRTRDVPRQIVDQMFPIMPSAGLIEHEWDKHGSCSGLGVGGYFELTQRLFEKINIPDELRRPSSPLKMSASTIERMFMRANPELDDDDITITCTRGALQEARLCFTKSGELRACSQSVLGDCPLKRMAIPAVR